MATVPPPVWQHTGRARKPEAETLGSTGRVSDSIPPHGGRSEVHASGPPVSLVICPEFGRNHRWMP